MAPLDVPWLRVATVVLAGALVVIALSFHDDASAVVQVNQVVVGAVIALTSLAVVIAGGEWLG